MATSIQTDEALKVILPAFNGKNYNIVVDMCIETELNLCDEESFSDSAAQFYSIFLVSLLITTQLNEAKYLWKRISPTYKPLDQTNPPQTPTSSEESTARECLENLWVIGASVWERNIVNGVQQILQTRWPQYLQQSLKDLRFVLVSSFLKSALRVYTNADVNLLQNLLGYPLSTFEEETLSLGITATSSGTINVLSGEESLVGLKSDAQLHSLMENVDKLAEYVSYMDAKPLKVDLSSKTKVTGK